MRLPWTRAAGRTVADGGADFAALVAELEQKRPGLVEAKKRVQARCCQRCLASGYQSIEMTLCPTCGNKRCPAASDHRLGCTGSNEPGQPGSVYRAVF